MSGSSMPDTTKTVPSSSGTLTSASSGRLGTGSPALLSTIHPEPVSRNTAVVLPYFSMALYLLPATDLVFTTSRHFARHFAKFLPLAILPPPFEFPRMRFYQLWHERTHLADSHRWLRSLLCDVGRQVLNEEG